MDKPTVHYRGEAHVVLNRAWLVPIDHPNHLEGHDVINTTTIRTSTIVSHDQETGRIETQNTIYVPEDKTS